jgi:hypothetical protein
MHHTWQHNLFTIIIIIKKIYNKVCIHKKYDQRIIIFLAHAISSEQTKKYINTDKKQFNC